MGTGSIEDTRQPDHVQAQINGLHLDGGSSEIIFLGTGSSSGLPSVRCALSPGGGCPCCKEAMSNPDSKNRRGNPSLLIRYRGGKRDNPGDVDGGSGEAKNILIDAGKTFKESVLRWFPKFGIRTVDAIVLTHEHADAILGLDDFRELQTWDLEWRGKALPPPTPVFLSDATYKTLCSIFPYLTKKVDTSKGEFQRMVSQLDFNCVPPLKTFNAMGLEIRTLPVEHGPDCICYGFDFGVRDRVVYLSDFTSISEEVYEVIEEREVSILVLDSLRPDKDSLTHIGLPTAVEVTKAHPSHLLPPPSSLLHLIGTSGRSPRE
mmetsp:Transcript_20356/g.67983  ORF Transcript_20356/g.67983 Transcript_20356/m.67983 type:complete len:319 (-) Transcript_20356:3196-4152(-)